MTGPTASGTPKVEFISPSSPLYLHPNESTSLSLTPKKFNGENYDLWADAVRNALDAKNKLAFIEGKVKKPITPDGQEESLEAVAWRQCNAMLKAWIRCSIDEDLHASISFTGTIMEVWKELKERYAAGNAPRVHQLKAELSDCKQKKDQSVVQYYTNLKTIWDELASYSKVPPCTCGAANEMLKEREEAKVHQFLMGLDTSLYGHIRSNLLMDDEVASLSRAYALVLREERHKAVTKGKEEVLDATAAMAARVTDATTAPARARVNNNSFEKEEPEIFHCGYCGKPWHTEENCWDKPGNQGRGRGRGGRGRRGRGRGGRGNYQRANAAGVADEGSNGNDNGRINTTPHSLGEKGR
ncbi:uncharacterized protein LOC141611019 isoform X2 [Silene latifolia]